LLPRIGHPSSTEWGREQTARLVESRDHSTGGDHCQDEGFCNYPTETGIGYDLAVSFSTEQILILVTNNLDRGYRKRKHDLHVRGFRNNRSQTNVDEDVS
jgi:hypothetical protein